MEFNLKEKPLDYKGKPAKFGSEQEELSYQDIFTIALNNLEENVGVEEKAKLFKLSVKINKDDVVQLTSTEIAKLKDRVHEAFPNPLIYGRVCIFLGDASEVTEEVPALAAVEDGTS